MKKLTITVNPSFQEGESSGQFLKFDVAIPKVESFDEFEQDFIIEKEIVKRLRYTVETNLTKANESDHRITTRYRLHQIRN